MFITAIKATTSAVKANIFYFISIYLFVNHLRQFDCRPGQLVPCLSCDANFVIYYRRMSKLYRVTHRNLTSFEWVVLRTAPKKNKLCKCVVSTRWCHSAHCKRVNHHCSKHVSRAPHFPFRRRAVDPSLSRSFNL